MRTVIAILMIVASVGAFVMFIVPKYSVVQVLSAEQKEYDGALANARKLQEKRQELLDQFNTFKKEDVDALKKLLPDNIDNVQLIIELDSLASRYGMALRDINVVEEERKQGDILVEEEVPYGSIDLEFSVTGPYDRFVGFVSDIEKSLRLVDIYDISFQPVKDNYQYSVKVKTYWLK